MAAGPRLAETGSTADLIPDSRSLPRRAPPPLGYFAETSRVAMGLTQKLTSLE